MPPLLLSATRLCRDVVVRVESEPEPSMLLDDSARSKQRLRRCFATRAGAPAVEVNSVNCRRTRPLEASLPPGWAATLPAMACRAARPGPGATALAGPARLRRGLNRPLPSIPALTFSGGQHASKARTAGRSGAVSRPSLPGPLRPPAGLPSARPRDACKKRRRFAAALLL